MAILLSILTPTLMDRQDLLWELTERLGPQLTDEVEFLTFRDNRLRECGAKRNALMNFAKGKYLCHIDDDELVSENFVARILERARGDYDLIAYNGDAQFDETPPFKVSVHLDNPVEQPSWLPNGHLSDIRRPPWHWCTWRSDLAREARFPEHYVRDEDWFWLQQVTPKVRTWTHIDEILFHHRYNNKRTTFK